MNIRRLVLGTAAGALAVTGAQAADLPVVPEPVDYVRICDAYGTGFYFIPGTETCLRVSGRIRTEYNVYFDLDEDDDVDDGFFDDFGFDDFEDQGYRFRARGYVRLDSRTATEFGLLRTYLDLFGTVDNDGGTDITLDSAFIQLGGLVFGRTATFYGFGGGIYTAESAFDLGNNTGQVNLIGYNFSFGNGFYAGIALEDNLTHRVSAIDALQDPTTSEDDLEFEIIQTLLEDAGLVEDPGAKIPDVVANIGGNFGFGSFQIMGATHYVEEALVTPIFGGDLDGDGFADADEFIDTRFEEDEFGFAVGGGIEVNVPFGNGTQFGIQAGYAHGALDYIADGADGAGAQDVIFVGDDVDGDGFVDDFDMELGDFFSVAGGFSTAVTPTVTLAAGAGFVYMDHDADEFDTENYNVQGNVIFTPVDGLDFVLGAEYRHVEEDDDGPFGGGDDDDDDLIPERDGGALMLFFRAQRTF